MQHMLTHPCPQLYEQILAENEKLKAQLRDTDLELADLKLQLEKATQVFTVKNLLFVLFFVYPLGLLILGVI